MNKYLFFVGATAFFLGLGTIPSAAIATTPPQYQSLSSTNNNLLVTLPIPPSTTSEPTFGTGHRGGGKRCGKKMDWDLFRVLLPTGEIVETLISEPSLWFYLPTPVKNPLYEKVELSIFRNIEETEDSELVYSQTIPTPSDSSGLLQVQLPQNLLKEEEDYWWDITVQIDPFDRSGDSYIYGMLRLQTMDQISLSKDVKTLESLTEALEGEGSYLSLDQERALKLATVLKNNPKPKAIAKVEKELRQHFTQIHDEYEQLNALVSASSNASDFSSIGFPFIDIVQRQRMLELAQLSAFFNIWGDTMNFAALNREAYPELWEMSLEKIFRDHELTAETNQPETIEKIVAVFSEASNYPSATNNH
ncbi:protein of unknown function DUF928 [[Leptolyngbya] sp. PCC 7376]|uniref:DUF928 domain-containing protein n=1 Tax=[Leptolyngbya] sp. PCC 7376 TaxID=111781 RepID=UPI00029F2837|nr:DUF928 domain-containing protein [[Leptolyngbya] sp. PCC 7376]AFY37599.1 protein of unknown function DUF928 [[Leptolyngbya] sp. PCC 7376]